MCEKDYALLSVKTFSNNKKLVNIKILYNLLHSVTQYLMTNKIKKCYSVDLIEVLPLLNFEWRHQGCS